MKVLFINNIPSPYRVDFLNELGKYCQLTAVFGRETARDRDQKWKPDEFHNFKAVFLRGIKVGTDASISFQIISVIREGFDMIFLGSYSSPSHIIAMEYMKARGIPFLLNADGGFVKRDKWPVRMLKRHIIGLASAWLSTGKLTDDYLAYYGANRDKIFRYPFTSVKDQERFCTQEAAKNETKVKLRIKEKTAVITVGQFIPRKGLDLLIRCCSKMQKDTGVYIIGGEPGEEYKKLLEDEWKERVHFIGFKSKEELKDYYIAADVFVFPTREDIWGLVLNEAMSYGLPCVASERAVASIEMIEDGMNGYLVDPEDTGQMADRLNRLLSDREERLRMGELAYEKSKEYTIENMAARHMEIFRQFLGRGF
ncbi:glycosyltransferase family 4 protein [Lacrimispora sp. 210928-DFI.3.58]|uniref:glycosyltransferase family 4 protein n=1 Tax=Lacrimispora sp. 210928-DFI.3.58 TaxID=2883214 RepID=UPI001D085BC7|nr:glycosyltransferase family 4 protein [Lacrimispora sp. 210928-DFI.3.58]MCB7320963.1 glycosyltransferase family 4 protein [Lacrimispora sp. 210928-DFI.3.58]